MVLYPHYLIIKSILTLSKIVTKTMSDSSSFKIHHFVNTLFHKKFFITDCQYLINQQNLKIKMPTTENPNLASIPLEYIRIGWSAKSRVQKILLCHLSSHDIRRRSPIRTPFRIMFSLGKLRMKPSSQLKKR